MWAIFLGVGDTSVSKTDKVPTLIFKKKGKQWTGYQTNKKISDGENYHFFSLTDTLGKNRNYPCLAEDSMMFQAEKLRQW